MALSTVSLCSGWTGEGRRVLGQLPCQERSWEARKGRQESVAAAA